MHTTITSPKAPSSNRIQFYHHYNHNRRNQKSNKRRRDGPTARTSPLPPVSSCWCQQGFVGLSSPVPNLSVDAHAGTDVQFRQVLRKAEALVSVHVTDGVVHIVGPFLVAFHAMARVYHGKLSCIIYAAFISSHFSCFAQHPELIATLVVTRPQLDRFVVGSLLDGTVNAGRILVSVVELSFDFTPDLSRG